MIVSPEERTALLELVIGPCGRILSATKSEKEVVYNGNVLIESTKVWFGDFRFTERYKLQDLPRLLQCKVYVLREMDCRFETEDEPRLDRAVFAYDRGRELVNQEKK